MAAKIDPETKMNSAIARMKSEYTAAGWKVVNEEAGAIALSKPAHYVSSAFDKGEVSPKSPRTLLNWLLGRA